MCFETKGAAVPGGGERRGERVARSLELEERARDLLLTALRDRAPLRGLRPNEQEFAIRVFCRESNLRNSVVASIYIRFGLGRVPTTRARVLWLSLQNAFSIVSKKPQTPVVYNHSQTGTELQIANCRWTVCLDLRARGRDARASGAGFARAYVWCIPQFKCSPCLSKAACRFSSLETCLEEEKMGLGLCLCERSLLAVAVAAVSVAVEAAAAAVAATQSAVSRRALCACPQTARRASFFVFWKKIRAYLERSLSRRSFHRSL